MSRVAELGGVASGPPAWFRIVAPLSRPDELPSLVHAGADEVYCGVLPSAWSRRYGDGDFLSRRQGTVANLSSLAELREVAQVARATGVPAALALNARYTAGQVPEVLDLALAWERAGGTSIILADLALLISLQARRTQMERHVSLLANVTNSQARDFFSRFGVTRVVLPRELSVAEMAAVTASQPDPGYEVMALHERCRFIDGLCGFYHGRTYPATAASVFPFEHSQAAGGPVAHACDLCYAGHGCRVPFLDACGRTVRLPRDDEVRQPACALCALQELHRAGVRFLKIGGRGLPTDLKVRAVAFLRRAVNAAQGQGPVADLRALYRDTFGRACRKADCYYPCRARAKE